MAAGLVAMFDPIWSDGIEVDGMREEGDVENVMRGEVPMGGSVLC